MELPNIENIYQWWLIVGKPNRGEVRALDTNLLPTSEPLLESLIPYFVKRSNNRDIISIPTQNEKSESSIVVTSDWHIPFEDKEAIRVFLDFLREYRPDELVLNGNINDMTAFSTHPKLRDLAVNFNSAREDRKKWFGVAELLRDILPDAKITYIGSQCHEGWLDQWVQYSPVLAEDYENYSIQGWLKLADFLIDYEPEVYDVMGNNELLITHGTVARSKGGTSAYATMEMEGTSIIQGHTHRLSQVYKTTTVGETVGIECGCLCQRTPWYHLKGRRLMMDWQQGFVLLNTKGNSFSAQCVPIIRDDDDRPYFWIGKERYR